MLIGTFCGWRKPTGFISEGFFQPFRPHFQLYTVVLCVNYNRIISPCNLIFVKKKKSKG